MCARPELVEGYLRAPRKHEGFFVNKLIQQIATIVLCTMIIVPAYGMENEQVEKVPAVWYKKRSVQIGAAVTGAAAIYAVALHMGKVAFPMLLAGWFVKTAHDASIVNVNAETDNSDVVNNPTNFVETPIIEHKEIIQNVEEQNGEISIPQNTHVELIEATEPTMQQQARNFMDNAWRKMRLWKDVVKKEATDSVSNIKGEDLMNHL